MIFDKQCLHNSAHNFQKSTRFLCSFWGVASFLGKIEKFWYDSSLTLQANCIDSTAPAEAVFAQEVKKLVAEQFKPIEQVTLEPFERDHACVVGAYRAPKKQKAGTWKCNTVVTVAKDDHDVVFYPGFSFFLKYAVVRLNIP